MKDEYPDSKSDLFAAFIARCITLTIFGGQLGFMTPYVWMFIKSYELLRKQMLTEETITSLIQLEYSGFGGATVPICTFTIQRGANPGYPGGYVRLADFVGPRVQAPKALEAIQDQTKSWFYRAKTTDFTAIPGSPIVYWLSEKMRASFSQWRPLGQTAQLLVGLRTGDNSRFLRRWWEVSAKRTAFQCTSSEEAVQSRARWFPYNKGGEFRRWYGNHEYVVNWEHDGREVETELARRYPYLVTRGSDVVRGQGRDRYFSPSVSWSKISSGAPAFRFYPAGFVYDVAGPSIFAATGPERAGLLSYTNSQVALEQLAAIAPTLNYEVGQVSGLPVADGTGENGAASAAAAIAGAKADWDDFETSWEFARNPLVAQFERG